MCSMRGNPNLNWFSMLCSRYSRKVEVTIHEWANMRHTQGIIYSFDCINSREKFLINFIVVCKSGKFRRIKMFSDKFFFS